MGKKSSDEDKMTLAEAYINFQINLKSKEIQECHAEMIQLETEKRRMTELRERLMEEVEGHVRLLRKQAKELELKLKQRETVHKEQVEQALQQNMEMIRNQERELAELQRRLRSVEGEVQLLQAERQVCLEYKNVGSQEHQQQIRDLEAELADRERSFQNMADNIKRSLEVTFNEMDKKTVELIEEKEQQAAEKAIDDLDEVSRKEIRENSWLQREIAVYKAEVSIIQEAVQRLEAGNLECVSQLLDLQPSRNVFLTQASVRDCDSTAQENATGPGAVGSEGQGRCLERDEGDRSGGPAAPLPAEEAPQDLWDLLYGGQTHLQEEPQQLGPLELQLLSVVGQAKPLHPLPAEEHSSPGANPPGLPLAPEEWALTAKIIHNRFK